MPGGTRIQLLLLTGFGAFAPFLAAPWISRIYSPEEYAEFAVLSAWIGILVVATCGRLENAVYMPSHGRIVDSIAGVATWIAWVVSTLIFIGTASTLGWRSGLMVGVACLVIGLFNLSVNMLNRRGEERTLSWVRFARPSLEPALAIGFGQFAAVATSLVASYALSFAIPLVSSWKRSRSVRGTSRRKIGFVLRRYRGFLLIDLPTGLMTAAAGNLLVILVRHRYGEVPAAYCGMAGRFAAAPLGIVQASIGFVVRTEMMKEIQASGGCMRSFQRFTAILAVMGGLSLLLLWSLTLFEQQVFGSAWKGVGHTLVALSTVNAVKIVAVPLSYLFYLREEIRWNSIYQVGSLLVTCIPFLVPSTLGFQEMLATVCGLQMLFYGFYFLHAKKLSGKRIAG